MSAVDYRRALHRIPELDNQLPETVQLVQRILAPLPCRVFSPITGSVCAWFDAGKSDAVAFRAELDALPVTEATDLPYASVHPGRMHACGHDAHTAMVLTLAEYAAEHLAELGLVVGEEVTVMNTLGGNLILQVKDSRIALDRGLANRIMVRGFANENA